MNRSTLIVTLLALIIALVVGIVGFKAGKNKDTVATAELLPGKPYQAVFLTNGQVYFGKITRRTPLGTTLKDIYYLQVQQPIQPPPQGQQTQPQIQLVKLGNELHKPNDEMVINNQHILFTEDLGEEGQVVTAIRRFQKGDLGATAPEAAPQAQEKQKTTTNSQTTNEPTE